MSVSQIPIAREETPTRWQALWFAAKAWRLRVRRAARNLGNGAERLSIERLHHDAPIVAESRSPLYPSSVAAEFALQAGKAQNLRQAAHHLNGMVLPRGKVFSFWRHVPRPSKKRGFVAGRELREGCVVPSVGGGLCQLSNALYDAALKAQFDIVERHAHSRLLPGSMAASGRDATIFWNYVDLRFRAPADCQIEVALESNDLVVRIRALTDPGTFHHRTVEAAHELFVVDTEAESCELCGVASCFRHPAAAALPHEATTAWLVDNWTPEADAFVSERRAPKDTLLIPFESRRWGLGPYRWNAGGFATVRSAPFFVARRSATSRRLSDQGADRQRALLRMDEDLARIYARQIPPTALHIVVNQNLLPFLWRDGVLAGRTFDVLMTRLPLTHLEAQLDCAARRWPETATLTDFRAPREIADAESAALRAADNWITPHTAIAALAGPRAIQLPWQLPARVQRRRGARVVFPAATLARKGAFEIREALRELNLPLTVAGPNLESPEFWRGHDIRFANANWLDDAAVVVLPAWVEHRPNRLLEALAAGLPVIATKACGLDAREGVTIVPEGDVDSLVSALRQALN